MFAKARAAERRLYDWMRQHHDDLLAELGEGRIRWTPALQVFASLQLTDEHGKTPTRDTAIRTWQRVRADVAAARARQQAAKTGLLLAPGEIAPGVVRVEQRPPAASATLPAAAPRPAMSLELRAARPLSDTTAAIPLASLGEGQPAMAPTRAPQPAPATVPADGTPGQEDADAQIRRLLQDMRAGKTPMPRPM